MKVYVLSIYNGVSWSVNGVYKNKRDVRTKIQMLEAEGRYHIDEKEVVESLSLFESMSFSNKLDDRMQQAFDDAINGDKKEGKK